MVGTGRRIPPALGASLAMMVGLLLVLALLALLDFAAGFLVPPAPTPKLGVEGDTVSMTLAYLGNNPAPLTPDADFLWRNQPGAVRTHNVNPRPYGTAPTWKIEINSLGFRGPEFVEPVDRSRRYRVLCIGDSITYGFNVDQGNNYPSQLLALLRERYPARDIEVINAGVPGWSWLQGLRFIEARGLALDPDLIIISHGSNDQFFTAEITDEERLHVLGSPMKRRAEAMLRSLQATNLLRALTPENAPTGDHEYSAGCREQIAQNGDCRRVSVNQIKEAVVRIARLVRKSRNADVMVMNTDFNMTDSIRGLQPAAEAESVPLVDVVSELSRLNKADAHDRGARLGLAPANSENPGDFGVDSHRVVARVEVPDAEHEWRVEIRPYLSQTGTAFSTVLRDDGSGGDEKAGDRVYSAALELTAKVGLFEYQFLADAVPEFEPLPPVRSRMGWRLLRVATNGYGPVESFGHLPFMAERTHPNREGHHRVAMILGDQIATLSTFKRWLAQRP